MKFKTSLLVVCALSLLCLGVLADDKDKVLKEHVQFSQDVMIGNTTVQKGYYLIKYNTESGMMKVIDESDGKKVIATAKATVKMNDKDFEHDEVLTKNVSGQEMLTGLRLGGQKEELTLTDNVASLK